MNISIRKPQTEKLRAPCFGYMGEKRGVRRENPVKSWLEPFPEGSQGNQMGFLGHRDLS